MECFVILGQVCLNMPEKNACLLLAFINFPSAVEKNNFSFSSFHKEMEEAASSGLQDADAEMLLPKSLLEPLKNGLGSSFLSIFPGPQNIGEKEKRMKATGCIIYWGYSLQAFDRS